MLVMIAALLCIVAVVKIQCVHMGGCGCRVITLGALLKSAVVEGMLGLTWFRAIPTTVQASLQLIHRSESDLDMDADHEI